MEYKGELKGFPSEIVEKMLEYQIQQRNEKDVSVLEENKYEGKREGGFYWKDTPEGILFWEKVIVEKDFNLFFEKYPKLVFEKDTAYHARTKEEAIKLFAEANRQGYRWYTGELYEEKIYWTERFNCYDISGGTWASTEFYRNQGKKIVSVKEFFNQNKKEKMNNRFPFKLSKEEGLGIIDAACKSWKMKLAQEWVALLFEDSVKVNEELYLQMRKAATESQHKLLDEIFGKDTPLVDFNILNDTDLFFIDYGNESYFSEGNPFEKRVNLYNCYTGSYFMDKLINKYNLKELRKASSEEIKYYYSMCPNWSIYKTKRGEPVWCRNYVDTEWRLRYSSGQNNVYRDQYKKGITISFDMYKKFDVDDLPYVD